MPDAATILEAREIEFRHPGASGPLFDGLTLRLARGEFAGVLGPNGSGKTTLLRLLAGTLAPRKGAVLLDGRPLSLLRPRERARRVALVPQESRPLFDFTLLEAVLMGRSPHLKAWSLERPDDYQAARAALREVDLAGREERRLSALSSGERQRALIARALAQAPEVLLLDEPTAFLDLKHRLQIYEILKRLNAARGMTVAAVSHDLNLAARYGSRLIVLHAGRIAADGAPARLITPDLIRRVYETEAEVARDPVTGAPYVLPRTPL